MEDTEKLLAIKKELEQISQRIDNVFPPEHPYKLIHKVTSFRSFKIITPHGDVNELLLPLAVGVVPVSK